MKKAFAGILTLGLVAASFLPAVATDRSLRDIVMVRCWDGRDTIGCAQGFSYCIPYFCNPQP